MTRLQIALLGLIVVIAAASITVSSHLQRRARAEQREREATLQTQADAVSSLSAENQRLSELVERTRSAQKLSQQELRELLRLRGEVGLLRETVKEKGTLNRTNAQLRAKFAESQRRIAEAETTPNYWAKNQLTSAGFADPESTMKTMLWAAMNGDISSWRSSCTLHAQRQLEAEWKKHNKSEAERMVDLKQMGNALTANATGFRIVGQDMSAPDEAIIKLQFVGEGRERQFVLKKIDNEWKFHDMLFAGQERQKKQVTVR